MEISAQVARIEREAEAFARAAAAGPLTDRVPGCSAWNVEALIRHLGDVHRWAALIVRERLQGRPHLDSRGPENGEALREWFAEGAVALVATLRAVGPEEPFWFWGPAPDALSFWARRQANETAMHRWDIQSARGVAEPLDADEAVDALDEWLGLVSRRGRAPAGGGRTLRFTLTGDPQPGWLVSLGENLTVSRHASPASCEVAGSASDLYLLAMNRQGPEGLTITGDRSLLEIWRDNVKF